MRFSPSQQITGEEAARAGARLHGKSVAPVESFIGHYGLGPSHAMLYISGFDSEDEAQSLLNDMSKRIGKGSSGFGHHQQFSVKGKVIHIVLDQEQVHYFFAKGKYLYWLGMVPDMARFGLAQLLEVDVSEIPTLESLMSNLLIKK